MKEIDQLLEAWDQRLARVDENLLALETEPTYQILAGVTGARAPLDGITKQRVYPALDALGELFEHRGRLTETLDRAKEVRASVGFWNKEERLQEVRRLLFEPSIKMGAVPTPLAKRGLLDPATTEVAVVPEKLLLAMAQAYEQLRDAVHDVKQAWERLEPSREKAEAEVAGIRGAARSLGIEAELSPELTRLDQDLGAVRARVARDPLGVSGSLDADLRPRIEAARQRVDALGGLRDRVTEELRRATEMRRRIHDAHGAARIASDRGKLEIEEAARLPLPIAEELIAGLDEWLVKLAAIAGEGRFQPVEIGLMRWFETAREYLTHDREIHERFDALAQRRDELAGRVSARRAQAAALSARGHALDPAILEKGREAEALLKKRPVSLAQAQHLVAEFEAAVIARARG
jgi:hypothetical protein